MKARKRLIPVALDDNELEVAPVIAKWLSLFATHSNENSFCYELCLSSDTPELRLSAARCIPFLVSVELNCAHTFCPYLSQAVGVIIDRVSTANFGSPKNIFSDGFLYTPNLGC